MAYSRARIVLGILSLLPLLSLGLLLGISSIGSPSEEITPVLAPFFLLVVVGVSMLCGLVLLFYYVYLVVTNSEFSMFAKVIWVVLLAGAGIITLPIFWVIYLRDRGRGTANNAQAS